MATVYLPMGYPLLEGNAFSNVIYQGRVVRLYSIPSDPRTEEQLFQRRFLADVTRMRATMSTWTKAFCKYQLGVTWATILFQAIKADLESCWTNSLEMWSGESEGVKSEWRDQAPHQATYNDPGKMFYCLHRSLIQVFDEWGRDSWTYAGALGLDAETTKAWWDGVAVGQLKAGFYDDTQLGAVETGTFQNYANVNCWMGTCRRSADAANQRLKFVYFGKECTYSFLGSPTGGQAKIYIDGVERGSFVSYDDNENTIYSSSFKAEKKGMHVVEFVRVTGRMNIDSLTVL